MSCTTILQAQLGSDMSLTIETGPILFSDSENLSFFLNVEPKLKASKNTRIGLRIAATVNSQSIENDKPNEIHIYDKADNGTISFVPTFDYRFNEGDFRPYLGIGIGYYLLAGYIEVSQFKGDQASEEIIEVDVDNQIGVLFRGGFDMRRIRLGIEYNLISKADLEITNGPKFGTVDNSYYGLVIGYTIGGNKLN